MLSGVAGISENWRRMDSGRYLAVECAGVSDIFLGLVGVH